MKTKILFLILLLLMVVSCGVNKNLTTERTCCGYQEYSGLASVGIPGAVDITTITRNVDNGVVHYTTKQKKVYNIYCQGKLDSLRVKNYVSQ